MSDVSKLWGISLEYFAVATWNLSNGSQENGYHYNTQNNGTIFGLLYSYILQSCVRVKIY